MKSYRQLLQGEGATLKKPAIVAAAGIFAVAGAILLLTTRASTTHQLYFGPSTTDTKPVGSTFTAEVRANSGTVPVNAVEVKVLYPADKLQFVGIDGTGSAFDIDSPASGNANGVVTLSRGKVGGVKGDVPVGKITFKVLAAGSATLSFGSGSMLLASSNNQSIVSSTGTATYALGSPTATPPPATQPPTPSPAPGTGKLYLTPATGRMDVPSVVTVGLRMNSGTVPVNAVETKISYPADKLEFAGMDESGVAFDINTPSSGAANGVVTVSRGRTGSISGDQLVVKLKFNVKAPGTAALTINSGGILMTSANQQNILGSVEGATFTLVAVNPFDLSGDGRVDITDVSLMFANWRKTGPGLKGDVNQDSIVDITDLSLMLAKWTGSI